MSSYEISLKFARDLVTEISAIRGRISSGTHTSDDIQLLFSCAESYAEEKLHDLLDAEQQELELKDKPYLGWTKRGPNGRI